MNLYSLNNAIILWFLKPDMKDVELSRRRLNGTVAISIVYALSICLISFPVSAHCLPPSHFLDAETL